MARLQGVQAVSQHMISQNLTARNADNGLRKSLPRSVSSLRVVRRLVTGLRVAPRPRSLRVDRGINIGRCRLGCWDRRTSLIVRGEEAWRGSAAWRCSEKEQSKTPNEEKSEKQQPRQMTWGHLNCLQLSSRTRVHGRRNHTARSSVGNCGESAAVAGYPDWAYYEGAVDERTEEQLPEDKSKGQRPWAGENGWARREERHILVWRSRAWTEDCQKSLGWRLEAAPGWSTRCEIKVCCNGNQHWTSWRRFQRNTSADGSQAHRIPSSHATEGSEVPPPSACKITTSQCVLHAKSSGQIAVIPPKDLYTGDTLCCSTKQWTEPERQASAGVKRWKEPCEEGFHAVETVPGIYRHEEWDVTVSCHGDDFLAEGCADGLIAWTQSWPKDLKSRSYQGLVLRRAAEWSKKDDICIASSSGLRTGFTWQADPKYAQQLVADLGLAGTKGVDSPASKETGKGNRDLDKPLSDSETKEFRRLAGTALYLSLDCPTIQFAMAGNRGRNGKANSVASTAVEATRSVPGKVSRGRVDLWNARATGRVASLHRQRLGRLCGIQKVHVFLLHQVRKTLVGHKLCKTEHSCT